MRKSALPLLGFVGLLLLAGCQSAAATTPVSANAAITATPASAAAPAPTATAAKTAAPTPTPPPAPPSHCPQIPVDQLGQAPPSAPLSLYATTSNDDLAAVNASTGKTRWKELITFPGDYQMSAAVEQNVVYALVMQAQGGYVEALNASDAIRRWCTTVIPPVDPSQGGGPPQLAVDAGAVYVGDGARGLIVALSTSDGTQLWRAQAVGGILSLRVADGQVYASSEDMTGHDTFSAFAASTGKALWHVQTSNGVFSSPTVANEVVYVGVSKPNYPEFLYALNARNGSQSWRIEEDQGAGFGPPAVVSNVIYVADNLGIYALNASNGAQRWHVQQGTTFALGPVVANGVLYAGSFDDAGQGIVYAFNTSDGSRRWQSDAIPRLPPALALLAGSPLAAGPDPVMFVSVGNGVVYASTFDSSAALNASDGRLLWNVAGRTLASG